MKFSYGLPTHRVDRGEELVSAAAITELTAAAEGGGFDAVYVTEHPFPSDHWLERGGHHALDPLVALSFAATAAPRIGLHTHLFIAGYRNPFLGAKGLASLDYLSEGRVIIGVGTGYLEGEFDALGMSFSDRADRLDESIVAMKAAWTGESVTMSGNGFAASGNTMLPRPAQRPHPPIWIGGNSKRAVRRAVELGDGWAPFPAPPNVAARTQTDSLATVDDLAERLAYAQAHAASVGRTSQLDVCYTLPELSMTTGAGPELDASSIMEACRQVEELGVTWLTVALSGETRAEQLQAIEDFSSSVLVPLKAG